MSSPDRLPRSPRPARIVLALLPALMLAACTVAPLYGRSEAEALSTGAPGTALAAVRGRISVAVANDRTAQIFRNALLFRLNGGARPDAPLYDIRYTIVAYETVVSIQQGSGIPSASAYRMNVSYEVVRLGDAKRIAGGSRSGTAPFDRTAQLFASSRAVLDAREQAGREVAERVGLAVAAAIRKDLAVAAARPAA